MNENEKIDIVEEEIDSVPETEETDKLSEYFNEDTALNEASVDSNDNSSEDEAENNTDEETPRKKFRIYTPVIIAASILAVCLIAFGAYKIAFTSSIEGIWVYSDELEYAKENDMDVSYLIFDKNGVASYCIGTYSYYGPYSVETKNGASSLNVSVPYVLSGTYEISIEGSKFSGNRQLKIGPDSESLLFLEMKRDEKTLDVSPDFAVNDKVVGKWYSEEQGVTYSIYADGTMTFDLKSEDTGMHIDGIYTVTDNIVTFKYITNEEVSTDIEYSINDSGNLVVQGIEYINVA